MKRLTIRGVNWCYKDLNTKQQEVILLVHGHPFDHSMWDYQHEVLRDFRLILPDLKGYGQTDHDFEKIYIEEQALDLVLLLDELQIKKVHLIGLSMGGQIIVEFQRLFPHRVHSLIICASLPNAETKENYNKRLALAETISKVGMLEYTAQDIHKYINMEEINRDTAEFKHLFKMMSETKVKGAVASHRGRAERRDNGNHVKMITIPTLMIAGEKDYFFAVDRIRSLAAENPNMQFAVVHESGHLPNLEKPLAFNKLVVDFYGEHFS